MLARLTQTKRKKKKQTHICMHFSLLALIEPCQYLSAFSFLLICSFQIPHPSVSSRLQNPFLHQHSLFLYTWFFLKIACFHLPIDGKGRVYPSFKECKYNFFGALWCFLLTQGPPIFLAFRWVDSSPLCFLSFEYFNFIIINYKITYNSRKINSILFIFLNIFIFSLEKAWTKDLFKNQCYE